MAPALLVRVNVDAAAVTEAMGERAPLGSASTPISTPGMPPPKPTGNELGSLKSGSVLVNWNCTDVICDAAVNGKSRLHPFTAYEPGLKTPKLLTTAKSTLWDTVATAACDDSGRRHAASPDSKQRRSVT
jgi:hypothetical protein